MYLFAFNGPPRSGKSSAAAYLARFYGFRRYELARRLKLTYCSMIGISIAQLERDKFRHRGGLIDLSDNYIKPRFGDDFYAQTVITELNSHVPHNTIITDLGKTIEQKTLEAAFPNMITVYFSRPGCDFSGDNREYVSALNFETIENVGSVNLLQKQLRDIMEKYKICMIR